VNFGMYVLSDDHPPPTETPPTLPKRVHNIRGTTIKTKQNAVAFAFILS